MAFTTIATTSELAPGQVKQVRIHDRALALFNIQGQYYLIDDVCPHRGAPLSEGFIEGGEVTCPWHGAQFDLRTGEVLSPPAQRGVTSYPVQVVGNDVQADVGG